jgi:hypothetical protein
MRYTGILYHLCVTYDIPIRVAEIIGTCER